MKKSPAVSRSQPKAVFIEILETRLVLSASFDLTGLTQLRSDPNFSNITGSGVTIAVLDTGIDAKNPDFSGKVLAFYNAVEDQVPSSITSSSVSSAVDNDGHGTHVSGIAASGDSSIGVAYGADLVDVKVIADSGESQLSGDPLLRGLEFVEQYASQFNIKVVNMSLGESNQNGGVNDNSVPAADDISRAIQTLESMGITVVAAAGNSYANDPAQGESYPAVVSTIAVANVWSDNGSGYDFDTYSYGTPYDSWAAVETAAQPDQFSATSQRSSTLGNMVVAPGMDIYSDWNGSSTDNSGSDLLHNTLSGTSMASPFISGVVALMQQAAMVYGGRYITDPAEILSIIQNTATQIGDPNVTGDGRVPISDGELTGGSEQQLPGTNASYDLVDVYQAIQDVKALFTGTTSNADTNDTTSDAIVITPLNGTASYTETGNIGTDGLNNVGASDVDLYKITLQETGTLSAVLADASGGTAFDASLILFDSNGNQLQAVTGTNSNGYPTLTTPNPLTGGTGDNNSVYYIGVSSAGNNAYNITDSSNATGGSTTGDYKLTVSISNPDPNGVPQGAVAVDLTDPNYVLQNNQVANEYVGDLGSDPAPDGSSDRVSVPNGDVDMFKIVAPDTGTLTADVDAEYYGLQGADSYVAVFDSNFNQITSDGSPSNFFSSASDSEVQFNVTLGQTYYVAVTVYDNASFDPTNPYGRATDSTATETYYNLYLIFNNGNSDGTALLAQNASLGHAINGSISSSNSSEGADGGFKYVDWYAYTANSTGLLDLDALSNTSGFTPNVQLWTLTSDDSSITEIGAVTGSGTSSPLIYQVDAGQTVYVSVTGAGNSNFNWYSLASGTGGETGSYTLNSSELSLSQLKTLSDNSIDNGTPETISPGQIVTGNLGMDNGLIQGSTDVDLYAFTPSVSGNYDIRTDTSQEGSADTLLRVFDVSGNQLAENDNASSATTASFIRYDFQAGQTYYIGVSGSGNSAYNALTGTGATAGATGTYVLSVSAATEPAISISVPASIREPAAGATATAAFTVTLDSTSTQTITVAYSTSNGSAIAGTDYTATSGVLTFDPGTTSQTIDVPILNDSSANSNTTFSLNLSSPTSAILSAATAQATIIDLSTNTQNFSQGHPYSYTDSSNHKISVELVGPGTGQIIFYGSDQTPDLITLNSTTTSTSLLVAVVHNQSTTLGNIQINGDLNSFTAPTASLNGDVSINGNLNTASLAGGTGSLTVTGNNFIRSITIGSANNFNLTTSGEIRQLKANEWIGTSVITAPAIQTLKVPGNFSAQLVLSNASLALESAMFGSLLAGTPWSITGSAKTINAGSVAPGFSADFGGNIASLNIAANLAGDFTAGSITNLKVRNSISAAVLTLTNGSGTDLGKLTVGGEINGSQIFSSANIGSIRAAVLSDSEIYAGVANDVSGLPTSSADFSSDASIASVTIPGTHNQYGVIGSDIAAATLGKINFGEVNIDNGGQPFGLAADQLADFSRLIDRHKLTWKSSEGLANLPDNGDLTENIFG
ncbi:MAG TPA: S8 family serine peptidase [Tepidisphaeraceae bacterium]|jgi:subtilisin family serine protease